MVQHLIRTPRFCVSMNLSSSVSELECVALKNKFQSSESQYGSFYFGGQNSAKR